MAHVCGNSVMSMSDLVSHCMHKYLPLIHIVPNMNVYCAHVLQCMHVYYILGLRGPWAENAVCHCGCEEQRLHNSPSDLCEYT